MLPVIGFGALAKLLGKGKLAQAGMALAGFGVIFVGIDTLQAGMKSLSTVFNPASFPAGGLIGRALLVAIGMLMTVIMQSSSAAVATTLTALAGGAINIEQAAALVIGQNVGTTVTAVIASIGASTAAKRTALVHVIFNAGTGLVAFVLLPWFTRSLTMMGIMDPSISIAAFHTMFNLLGVLIFIPIVSPFARWISSLVKEQGTKLTRHLDSSSLTIPAIAIEATRRCLKQIGADLYEYLSAHLKNKKKLPDIAVLDEIDIALDEVRHFLAKIPPPDTEGYEFNRQISTIHSIEHLERLTYETRQTHEIKHALSEPKLRQTCHQLAELLDQLAVGVRDLDKEPNVEQAETFSQQLVEEHRAQRPTILAAIASRKLDSELALANLSAQRWLDRTAYHLWRTSHHLKEMTKQELAEHASTNADAGITQQP
jgi:phosphate:Na+ symporter